MIHSVSTAFLLDDNLLESQSNFRGWFENFSAIPLILFMFYDDLSCTNGKLVLSVNSMDMSVINTAENTEMCDDSTTSSLEYEGECLFNQSTAVQRPPVLVRQTASPDIDTSRIYPQRTRNQHRVLQCYLCECKESDSNARPCEWIRIHEFKCTVCECTIVPSHVCSGCHELFSPNFWCKPCSPRAWLPLLLDGMQIE